MILNLEPTDRRVLCSPAMWCISKYLRRIYSPA